MMFFYLILPYFMYFYSTFGISLHEKKILTNFNMIHLAIILWSIININLPKAQCLWLWSLNAYRWGRSLLIKANYGKTWNLRTVTQAEAINFEELHSTKELPHCNKWINIILINISYNICFPFMAENLSLKPKMGNPPVTL